MNSHFQGYVIYYPDKYYKLLWELGKDAEYSFERRDIELGGVANSIRDLFFGYYVNIEELEVEIFLYRNKGIKGQLLVNAKPLPDFVMISKGEDPGDYIGLLANTIKKMKGVRQVVTVPMSNFIKIKELIYN
ncbi:MAG: hypothetical protein M0R38_06955 [Bacteroidia bacterium]|nr:hypothetical protein [Bacteroidia bacterium]